MEQSSAVSIINGDIFGGNMTLEEVKAAFASPDKNCIRAIGKIVLFLREQAVGDATNAAASGMSENATFNLGSGNALAMVAQHLSIAMYGNVMGSMCEIFEDRSKPKSDSEG